MVVKIGNLQQEIQKARENAEQAQILGNFSEAGKLRYEKIPNLEIELKETNLLAQKNNLLREEVTINDIALIVSR